MILIYLVVGFLFGLVVGSMVECNQWRKNANVPYRIYSKKRLYKVSYADKLAGFESRGKDNK